MGIAIAAFMDIIATIAVAIYLVHEYFF